MTSTLTRPVDNVVIATKGLQDRNTNIIAGTAVENKGKLILRLLIVHQCFLMMLSRKIIVRKTTLQTTNSFLKIYVTCVDIPFCYDLLRSDVEFC